MNLIPSCFSIATPLLLVLAACSQERGQSSSGAENNFPLPFLVRSSDVASRVEIIELLETRYETADGLRPSSSNYLSDFRQYQVAIARAQYDYLPNTSQRFAFLVNVTIDGEEHESVLDEIGSIEIGDTGVVYGLLAAGPRSYGALGDYYDPTWSLLTRAFSRRFLRDTVIGMRQAGQQIEALEVTGWCEFSAGHCENSRTGWSATVPDFEAMMVTELAAPRLPTPWPHSSYP